MKDGKFEAHDIYALLMKKYSDGRQWLCAGEVANATGGGLRRLDFVACNCYESQGYGVHAFEIKVSKSDLRRELENPQKHNLFFDDIDTYSIVAPDYVLDAEYKALVPKSWGIYTACTIGVMKDGREESENTLKTVRKPLALHDEKQRTMRRDFAMSLLRAISHQSNLCRSHEAILYEERQKGYREGVEYANKHNWALQDAQRKIDENKVKVEAADALLKEMGLWGGIDAKRMVELSQKARSFIEVSDRLGYWLEKIQENIPEMILAAKELKEFKK